MGRRGPRPEPTSLKLLRGVDRNVGADEPAPDVVSSIPEPPALLGEEGRLRWREAAGVLVSTGVLTDADLHALELYAAAWDELRECEAAIAQHGAYFTAESGYVGQHPAVNRSFKARDVIRRFMLEFGMTPSSRTGVKVATTHTASAVPKRKRG